MPFISQAVRWYGEQTPGKRVDSAVQPEQERRPHLDVIREAARDQRLRDAERLRERAAIEPMHAWRQL